MKRNGIAATVIVLGALALIFTMKSARQVENRPQSPPAPVEAATVQASPGMRKLLDGNRGAFGFTDQNFRERLDALCHACASHPTEPFPLDIVVDPDVKITVDGRWRNVSLGAILDDICQKNNLIWSVIGPDSIKISNRE